MRRPLLVLVAVVSARAQYTAVPSSTYPTLDGILNGKLAFQSVASAPATCVAGKEVYRDSGTGKWYSCTATDTWSEIVLVSQSYSNPSWITALAYAKITGVPSFEPAIAGGTTGQYWRGDKSWQTLNAAGVTNAADTTGSYANPSWITALAYAKITGVPSFEPAIAGGTTSQYWRGDKSWQTLNAAGVTNAADTTGSYANPSWITALAYAKITGVPSFEPAIAGGTTGQYWRGDKSWQALAAVATSGSATDLGSGTLPAGRLPLPGASTLGGVKSLAAGSHQFLTAINTDGSVGAAQPTTADISGLSSGDVSTGGTITTRMVGCHLFTLTNTDWTAAAVTKEVTLLTGVDAPTYRFDEVTISETVQVSGNAGTFSVCLQRPSGTCEIMPTFGLKVSAGDANYVQDRPGSPSIATGTYNVVALFTSGSGNLSTANAGTVTFEVCGHAGR